MPLSDSDIVAVDNDVDVIMIDRDDVSNYNPDQILPETPEVIQKIRSWLQPTSYDIAGGEYRKHLASHVAGTGAWLTSSTTYQEWLTGAEHGLLWIKGIPGSGKSVMAANLIDEIRKSNPGCPVLFFFFRQIIKANHEPQAMLRDWMDQVLDYSPPLQKHFKAYMEGRRSIDSLSIEDMFKDLQMAFAGLPGKVFCVADALDEMNRGNDTFLKALGSLGQWRPGTVKVLMTSRPVPAVEGPLRQTPCLHLRLQENLVDIDISTYVHYTLSNSAIPQSNWQVIANAVPGRANGLFLYAKLAMDAFLEPDADINQVLSQLPADMNILFTDLLQEHAQKSGVAAEIQHLILQSITHATRPLRLLELAEMVNVSSPDCSTRDLKATKDLIRAACGPLLEILADETVSVVHHSFTEYLKGTTRSDDGSGYPILQVGPTHAQLAVACLRYLQARCLDDIKVKPKVNSEDHHFTFNEWDLDVLDDFRPIPDAEVQLRLKHPFFEYAASNWHHHVNRSDAAGHDQTEVNSEIRKFLTNNQSMEAWLRLKWPGMNTGAGLITQLHIAASGGLMSYTKELLSDKTVQVDAVDESGETPLYWAASKGHSEIIRDLVAAGANPDQDETACGLKPLHLAASNNHHEAITVLLEAGVDPLTPKTRENPGRRCFRAPRSAGQTPLMYACHNGHLEAVDAFLPFIKDIDSVHRALAWAAEKGASKVVARILDHPGVDVNAKVRGDTALFLALGSSDVATVTALLQAGADPSADSSNSGDEFSSWRRMCFICGPKYNCMHQLCGLGGRGWLQNIFEPDTEGLQNIFELLVEAGVDIHKRTSSGATPLHGAVTSPDSPLLTRLLLDAGADANVADNSGSTPLHRVTDPETMQLLIEEGHANIDAVDEDGRTPLLCLLSTYHCRSIVKLLEYEPNCNIVDNKGDSALHISLKQRDMEPEIIQGLLKRGADPNLRNRQGRTPLLSLGNDIGLSSEIIDLLLKAGADIDARDRDGSTMLSNALSSSSGSSSQEYIRKLLDKGASLSVRDFKGRTLLHQAVECHDVSRAFDKPWEEEMLGLDILIGLGLDTKAVDYRGNSLLHEVALRRGNHESYHGPKVSLFWEQLLAMDLDLEQKNYAGRTPLHILCAANTHSTAFALGASMPIDFVIARTKNLDVADSEGITPLHIAVTGGESYTKKLLDAGANPAVVTDEGLTPLHLASRCRESNVVGLLLDALRGRGASVAANTLSQLEEPGTVKRVMGVDAKTFDKDSITPLFYACRSGRPETVKLLLEAGADVKIGRVFAACAAFERENDLWKNPSEERNILFNNPPPLKDTDGNGGAIALKLDDVTRRCAPPKQCGQSNELLADETTRLEEILDMLIEYGADLSEVERQVSILSGMTTLNVDERDYTLGCLIEVRDKNQNGSAKDEANLSLSELMYHCLRGVSAQTFKNYEGFKPGDNNQWTLNRLLARREYYLVEQLARQGTNFLPDPDRDQICNLAVLIEHGFASLVEKIGALEAESRLEKGDWHAFGDKTRSGLWYAKRGISSPDSRGKNFKNFLLEAVRRELPNMEVVQLLVEKFGVDINELHYTSAFINNVPSDSALLYVSRGNSWWHVHQALPYLLKAGADVNIRNHKGRTPLHMALLTDGNYMTLLADGNYPGPFNRDAAKILVEAGADVNAIDNEGRTCLACAQHDVDIIRLLKSHGATVTADAIGAAIEAENAPVLRELLSGGIDANMRCDKPTEDTTEDKEQTRGRREAIPGMELHEVFPLYYAGRALSIPRRTTPKIIQELEANFELVQVLLDHGADPFAKFLALKSKKPDIELDNSEVDTPSTEVPQGYKECTILHELLLEGKMPDKFLRLPRLDVNHRDAKGRTLLLAACQGGSPDYVIGSLARADISEPATMFQRLISLGAELEARDNFGRNILHYMIGIGEDKGRNFDLVKDSFASALRNAPGLINQADSNGKTPLHYAVARAASIRKTQVAEILLSAGADPLAVSKNGDNVLHVLAQKLESAKQRALFQDLVGRGVDVNARNTKGETPLFAFCNREMKKGIGLHDKNEEPLEKDAGLMLNKLGADFFARDSRGRGLLHVAASGNVVRFKELMDLGLDVMLEDNSQQTAIDVAAACGNKKVLELFEKKD